MNANRFYRIKFLRSIGLVWLVKLGPILALALLLAAHLQTAGAARTSVIRSTPTEESLSSAKPVSANPIFIPFVVASSPPSPWFLLGTYAPYKYFGDQQIVNQYLIGLDAWANLDRGRGQGHALAGDFKDLEVNNVETMIPTILETLWSNGYTPFFNIPSTRTAAELANGCCDNAIRGWARAYALWVARGGNRRAFIGPLEEMNGYWPNYALDPANFKIVYQRFQTFFAQEGATRDKVWWVFAPNGYTRPSDPPMSAYYPGDDKVDVVAFSAYNWGACASNPWPKWETFNETFGQFITLIKSQVTSAKPIWIAETGVTSAGGVTRISG